MDIITVAKILVLGGTWILQDAIASLLYYLNRDDQSWHYDQLLRCLRGLIGVLFIAIGFYL